MTVRGKLRHSGSRPGASWQQSRGRRYEMTKRVVDVALSAAGLAAAAPVVLPVMFIVWRQDRHSPFYVAPRVGRDGVDFRMVKLRSMVVNADKTGVDSTAGDDMRITPVGHFIRRYKLDEVTQLWNVLKGDMSLVGPRPNVKREVDEYTPAEMELLRIRPGITDLASIVFSDEGEVLRGEVDADLAYNQLIRPWKSRLGLFYVQNRSLRMDLQLLALTLLGSVSRGRSLDGVNRILAKRGAPDELALVALRRLPLEPKPPPGMSTIVRERVVKLPEGDPVG